MKSIGSYRSTHRSLRKRRRLTSLKTNEYKAEAHLGSGFNKEERINTTLASGNMPKVMTLPDLEDSAVVSALRSGMFWEIGPYFKDYPNLRNLINYIENISVDGKVYGIYRERPMARQGVVIRKDWLDNLGLEMPETVDDLYKIAKAFTEQDPIKRKDDTFGLADRNDLTFGAFKPWLRTLARERMGNGRRRKSLPLFKHEAYKDAMAYMKSFMKKA
ncbi:extracellular solute-binding protein [Bacillus licheniformis]|nr:extracellular solute-binding protein [Bacillus licheniformis]